MVFSASYVESRFYRFESIHNEIVKHSLRKLDTAWRLSPLFLVFNDISYFLILIFWKTIFSAASVFCHIFRRLFLQWPQMDKIQLYHGLTLTSYLGLSLTDDHTLYLLAVFSCFPYLRCLRVLSAFLLNLPTSQYYLRILC